MSEGERELNLGMKEQMRKQLIQESRISVQGNVNC